jgi:phosphomannomutase
LRDVTEKHGGTYFASAVGEVNVVEKMKQENCIIGGEGNGGVIYPVLHYGRDALAGIALFLSHLAASGTSCTDLRKRYPTYEIIKNKIALTPETDIEKLLLLLAEKYAGERISRVDGLKIDLMNGWIHLRKSNTEPIIRIYAEAVTKAEAELMISDLMGHIEDINIG